MQKLTEKQKKTIFLENQVLALKRDGQSTREVVKHLKNTPYVAS